MINKPNGYDETDAIQGGERPKLPAGKYICTITHAAKGTTRQGQPKLLIAFDVDEGEYAGFFMREYARTHTFDPQASWPGAAALHQRVDDDPYSVGRLKSLLNAIEKSNPGFKLKWPLDEKTLIGNRVGVIFRDEEAESLKGNIYIRSTIFTVLPIDQLDDVSVPELKTLAKPQQGAYNAPISDESIPF